MIWDGEAKERLRVYLEVDRLSASETAAKFGVTSNSIIGAAHRYGYAFARKAGTGFKLPGEKIPRPRSHRPRVYKAKQPLLPFEPQVETPPESQIEFIDLNNWTCRYPYGGDELGSKITFCGRMEADMIVGQAYCQFHSRLTRVKTEKLRVNRFLAAAE